MDGPLSLLLELLIPFVSAYLTLGINEVLSMHGDPLSSTQARTFQSKFLRELREAFWRSVIPSFVSV